MSSKKQKFFTFFFFCYDVTKVSWHFSPEREGGVERLNHFVPIQNMGKKKQKKNTYCNFIQKQNLLETHLPYLNESTELADKTL